MIHCRLASCQQIEKIFNRIEYDVLAIDNEDDHTWSIRQQRKKDKATVVVMPMKSNGFSPVCPVVFISFSFRLYALAVCWLKLGDRL